MLYLSYVLKSGLRLVVKYFHIVAFVFSLNKRILMLLSPLVLSLSTTSLVPSQPELQTFRKKQQQQQLFAENKNKRKTMDAGILICMHLCFYSDCGNASGVWQHGL